MKKPIFYEYDLEGSRSAQEAAVIHEEDNHTEIIELRLTQKGEQTDVSGMDITARFVSADGVLLSDGVVCSVNEQGNIMVPIDNAAVPLRAGYMCVEVSLTDRHDVLTLQFPFWVRVQGTITGDAAVSEETQGTVAELLRAVREQLSRVGNFTTVDQVYDFIDTILSGGASSIPVLRVDDDNPSGDIILYYIDSEERRFDLFNFKRGLPAADISGKADRATTLNGYGITDAYTKTQVDNLIQSAIGGIENGSY